MPTRMVDGDAIGRSDKLAQVTPVRFRAEFALLLTLARAKGTFECDARKIWATLYAWNRPDVSDADVAAMLDEYERVKMLFRWRDAASGKVLGYWVGNNKSGRLPGKSTAERFGDPGPEVPWREMESFGRSPLMSHSGVSHELVMSDSGVSLAGFGLERKGEERRGLAGGAGGGAPASQGESSGDPEDSSAGTDSSASLSLSKAKETATATATAKTPAPPQSLPDKHRKVTVPAAPAAPGLRRGEILLPVAPPRHQPASGAHQSAAGRLVTPAEPWDALDALMSLYAANLDAERVGTPPEDYHGHPWRQAGRAVFRAFCDDDSRFWPGKVKTEADLLKYLPKMTEQTPPDYRIPGTAVNPFPVGPADPNCSLCGGNGGHLAPDPSREALRGSLPDHWVDQPRITITCPCRIASRDLRPWRKFRKTAA